MDRNFLDKLFCKLLDAQQAIKLDLFFDKNSVSLSLNGIDTIEQFSDFLVSDSRFVIRMRNFITLREWYNGNTESNLLPTICDYLSSVGEASIKQLFQFVKRTFCTDIVITDLETMLKRYPCNFSIHKNDKVELLTAAGFFDYTEKPEVSDCELVQHEYDFEKNFKLVEDLLIKERHFPFSTYQHDLYIWWNSVQYDELLTVSQKSKVQNLLEKYSDTALSVDEVRWMQNKDKFVEWLYQNDCLPEKFSPLHNWFSKFRCEYNNKTINPKYREYFKEILFMIYSTDKPVWIKHKKGIQPYMPRVVLTLW